MALAHLRRSGLVALLAVAACGEPGVGGKVLPPPAPAGYELAVTGVTIDATRHAVVSFTVTNDAAPVALADLPALRPSFTLAALLTDPVSGLPAWQSYLLTGPQVLANLPLGGPGTPPALVLQNQRQPGAEVGTAATLAEPTPGRFTMTFATPLPAGYPAAATTRVGAWLDGVTGTARTSATFDWVPAGGTPVERLTVLDSNCATCHGVLLGHGRRHGARLCLTCHTTQNADPDTQDPAALTRGLSVLPEARTVVAGTASTAFTATLLSSTAAVSWTLSPATGAGTLSTPTVATTSGGAGTSTVRYTPPAADAAVLDPIAVTLTAAVTIQGAATGGYTPPPVTLTAPVAITVVQPPAAPAVAVNPQALTVVANGPAQPLSAVPLGVTGTPAWTISPATGAGTLSPASGASVNYTPPAAVAVPTTVTVTATAGGQAGATTITVLPGPSGGASRSTDPNPLDLGRLVHRIHRGVNLPTNYLSSSIAPAPALPAAAPVAPATGSLPLPFLAGRNAVAPGSRFSYAGPQGVELLVGRVVSRVENSQPPKVVAEGIGFPRDLRDCDACHRDAPQAAEVVTAISRRTCQSCHPDVWFGAGPITDLVHFAHAGGPQADDAACAGCHVAGPGLRVPIAVAHQPVILAPTWNPVSLQVTRVTGFQAGQKPTVCFQVSDRVGELDSLSAPAPSLESGPDASPVPRALARVSIVVAGPTTDYLTGNATFSQTVPLTTPRTTGPDGVVQEFCHTFTVALPAAAAGTWGLGMEARRVLAVPLYDPAADAFRWPYTGESVTEYADNPVLAVDAAIGTWPGGAPEPRREAVDRERCRRCHVEVNFHGSLRHNPAYCVLCHTPDATDWSRRPKNPDGNVNLSTVWSDAKFGTYDGLEERSIHFKVMIHRIHTGEGQGTARIEVGAPHVIAGLFLDDIRFPNRLADCTLCHAGTTWLIEGQPATAAPTTANETGTLLHSATSAHGAAEAAWPPVTATCNSCHGTAFAYAHAARYTAGGVESCAQCHTRGSVGVPAAHGLTAPTSP